MGVACCGEEGERRSVFSVPVVFGDKESPVLVTGYDTGIVLVCN